MSKHTIKLRKILITVLGNFTAQNHQTYTFHTTRQANQCNLYLFFSNRTNI